jgi:hypothetical protein
VPLRHIQDRADHGWKNAIHQLVRGRTLLGWHIQVHGRMSRALDKRQLFGASSTDRLGRGRQRRYVAEEIRASMDHTGQIRHRAPKFVW